MSKTNDEVICDFYRYIIELPEKDYYAICKCMREREPIPGMTDDMTRKADKKRKALLGVS